MRVSNGFGNRMDKDVSQICVEVLQTRRSSPQELGDSFRNHVSEAMAVYNSASTSLSTSVVSDSPVTSHLLRDDSYQETISPSLGFLVSDRERGQGGGSVLQVDVVSISSNILSNSSIEISNREARQNSRDYSGMLFQDAVLEGLFYIYIYIYLYFFFPTITSTGRFIFYFYFLWWSGFNLLFH